MTPPAGSPKRKGDTRREQVRISVTSDSSPASSRGSSPNRSLSSKLFHVVAPESNVFELRSPSNATRRNTVSPTTTPTLPPPRSPRQSGNSSERRFISRSFLRRTINRIVDSLWVNDSNGSRNSTPRAHLHGDEDLPSTSQAAQSRSYGLSRLGQLVVLCLLFLGLLEILGSNHGLEEEEEARRPIRIKGRNPFAVLKSLQPSASERFSTSIPSIEATWRPDPSSSNEIEPRGAEGDVTAVLLHWKRTDNLKVIVASLCRYDFIRTILIWNNNLDLQLNQEMFSSSRCPTSKLQIYNSPQNLLFLARHLGCMQATTPYCYFQDDDWFVQPMRSLYAQFKRDPEGSVVVGTTKEMAIKYRSEWCFFQKPLHTCFTWLGTGAFTSRNHVANYLEAVSTLDFPRDELAHADNSFTTFLNNPPYVMGSNAIVEMKSGKGYSDGEKGDLRNQLYTQKGLENFVRYLNANVSKLPPTTPLPTSPIPIDTSFYRSPSAPPLTPHPYAHHVRSPCAPSDLCFFLTNIPLLLPPDATPYPGPNRVKNFSDWENHVRSIGRAERDWSLNWGYENAVDSKPGTAFRSIDVAKSGDYVALGLIQPLDPIWTPSIVLHFILEDVEKFLPSLEVQVSSDGYEWTRASSTSPKKPLAFSCTTTNLRSNRPDISFPDSTLLSPLAVAIRQSEIPKRSTKLGEWWEERRRRREKLRECRVELSSKLELNQGKRNGWRFARLIVDDSERSASLDSGWGVYEIWLKGKVGI